MKIAKGLLTADCIEQSKMFKIEQVMSKHHGSIPVPYSRLFPWKVVENDTVKAYFVFYGRNQLEHDSMKLAAESFEVDQKEYERVTEIFHRFEKVPSNFELEDWELAKRKNWGRNDEFRKSHPLPRPYVETKDNKVIIQFRGLYPCRTYLGTDEPELARQIMSIANKNGYLVSSKAIHHVIRGWMDDFKSGDCDPIKKLWVSSPCGHNHLWVTIEHDETIKKRDRYCV